MATGHERPRHRRSADDGDTSSLEHAIVKDDRSVRGCWSVNSPAPMCRAIVTTGAPGSPRATARTSPCRDAAEATSDGFGELFRMLSFQAIGPAADDEPGLRGIAAGTSSCRCRIGGGGFGWRMERLPDPELGHLVEQAGR